MPDAEEVKERLIHASLVLDEEDRKFQTALIRSKAACDRASVLRRKASTKGQGLTIAEKAELNMLLSSLNSVSQYLKTIRDSINVWSRQREREATKLSRLIQLDTVQRQRKFADTTDQQDDEILKRLTSSIEELNAKLEDTQEREAELEQAVDSLPPVMQAKPLDFNLVDRTLEGDMDILSMFAPSMGGKAMEDEVGAAAAAVPSSALSFLDAADAMSGMPRAMGDATMGLLADPIASGSVSRTSSRRFRGVSMITA